MDTTHPVVLQDVVEAFDLEELHPFVHLLALLRENTPECPAPRILFVDLLQHLR